MDLKSPPPVPVFSKKEEKLKKRLEKMLAEQDLTRQRQLIERICQQSAINPIDCAAALVLLSQANLYTAEPPTATLEVTPPAGDKVQFSLRPLAPPKMVCYRLEVGTNHQVTVDEIKSVFVKEAGVDINMIGEVNMRAYHTVIELPEGMPADIYHLLATVTIQQQKLNIKRLKPRDRNYSSHVPRKKR
jgi:hypothetical protein